MQTLRSSGRCDRTATHVRPVSRKTLCYSQPVADQRTVTISIPPALAREVDRLARREGRTRGELLREAFRQYATRMERWDRVFELGEAQARRDGLSEDDVVRIIKDERRARARR